MSSFNQQECLGCGQPCDGLYCYPCTCQQCGVGLTNRIFLICTYRDGKPLICCKCEGPLIDGLCWFCASNSEISFNNDPNPNSFDDSQNLSDYSPQPQYETYPCELCGNDSHYGYDCPPRFDQFQLTQSSVTQQLPQRSNKDIQLEMAKLIKNSRILLNNNIFPHKETSMSILLAKEIILKLIQAWEEKQIKSWSFPELLLQLLNDSRTIDEMLKQREQMANLAVQKKQEEHAVQSFTPYWNFSMINDEEVLQAKEKFMKVIQTILQKFSQPEYSLSMGDGHLSTISETKSDEVIKYSVMNLVQIPSEYEVTSDNESECDVPDKDESSLIFTTFSIPTFDYNDDFTSSDDELLSKEDVPMENFKIYSNPLFDDEEINFNKIDPHYFNAESDLTESLSNRDTLFDSSPKFDYLEEFSGKLMPTSIINEERIKREHEEYTSLMEKLLTINSFPRPLENFHANTIIETLPTSPIPVEDNDSLREEIDIFTGTDDFMPPDIKSDDHDLKGDNHFLENYLAMILFPFPKTSHLTLIIMMIRHFLVHLRNHRMLRFSSSPIWMF
nr:hypothetical protein [Tanacetum cinerariifolium]